MENIKHLAILILGLATMAAVCLLSYDLGVKDAELKQEILETHIENGIYSPIQSQAYDDIKFIWNDDLEAIPKVGSLVRLNYIDGNTIYIGVYEPK
jgi:hypothetical protein